VHHNRQVGHELLTSKALITSVVSSLYQTGSSFAVNGVVHRVWKTLDGHYIGITRFLDYVEKNATFRASGEKGKLTTEVLDTVVRKFEEAQRPATSSAVAQG
jgi:hypothetical protein